MTQELRAQLIARLMKEDKSGLAYCLNKMMVNLGGGLYQHFMEQTKKELRENIQWLSDDQLNRLKDFQTYKDLF